MISTYDNIILAPTQNTTHSCITCFFGASANKENDEKGGTAHLLEHTLTAQADFGDTFEAETQLEYVLFQTTQLSEDTTLNLKKFKKLLFEDALNESVFITQQNRVKLELLTSYQHHMFQDAYGELFGHDSAQKRGWSGSLDSIESITFEDILEYRQNFFHDKNIIIVISGNFNESNVLMELSNPSLKEPVKLPSTPYSLKNKVVWNMQSSSGVAGADIFIPIGTPSSFEKQALAAVFQHSLIGGNRALIDTLLCKELGTVYSVESELLHWTNGSVFAFGFETFEHSFEKTTQVTQKLLTSLPNELSEEIVDTARSRAIIKFNSMSTNPDLFGRWIGENALLTGRVATQAEYVQHLKSCTYKDIVKKAETVSKMPHSIVSV